MNDLISQIERGDLALCKYHEWDNGDYYTKEPEANGEILRLAKLGQQRDWIPVTERLPEIDYSLPEYEWRVQANVVFRSGGKIKVGYAVYASNGYAKTEKGRAPRWEDQSGRHFGFEILYWMPLPALPEQEGR